MRVLRPAIQHEVLAARDPGLAIFGIETQAQQGRFARFGACSFHVVSLAIFPGEWKVVRATQTIGWHHAGGQVPWGAMSGKRRD